MSDSRAKRAGLDYWPHVKKNFYSSSEEFASTALPNMHVMLMFSKAERFGSLPLHQTDIAGMVSAAAPHVASGPVNVGVCLGSETTGITFLPGTEGGDAILDRCAFVYLPMHPGIRSHNLANTASIALWEAARQSGQGADLDEQTAGR